MVEQTHDLSGNELRDALAAGVIALRSNVDVVNALNVFPVPDGDTGTNMLLTVKAAHEEACTCSSLEAGAIATAMAHGALMGARGNSGVILSQFFRGLAKSLEGQPRVSAYALASGFRGAEQAAYKAVSNPVEGTILTVMRGAADAAEKVASNQNSVVAVIEEALVAAQEGVRLTPELMPLLKNAGVVDAGAQGFALMLEGATRYLHNEAAEEIHLETTLPKTAALVSQEFLDGAEEVAYGYCTQFLIQGERMDVDGVRQYLSGEMSSTVVVGDEHLLKVHVHTLDPGKALIYGVTLGTLAQISIQNMDEQHQEWQEGHRPPDETQSATAIVAVVYGDGLEKVFRSLGVQAIVRGGQTMNPSCENLLDAVRGLNAREVILLPNNSNVISTAQQAASLSETPIHVVATRSLQQGIAASVAYNPGQSSKENATAMEQAAARIQSGEVTAAIRDALVDGVSVQRGTVMGLLEGKLVATGNGLEEVAKKVVSASTPQEGDLITLYLGAGAERENAEELAKNLDAEFPNTEIEVVEGGQPHYPYLVAIE